MSIARTRKTSGLAKLSAAVSHACCGALVCTLFALGSTSTAHAQGLGWEGETGIFVTPLAYTAPVAEGKTFGRPLVAYHYFGAGNVGGNFYNMSITAGIGNRFEFGYTRQQHQGGGANTEPSATQNTWAASFFGQGLNTFHAKVKVIPENFKKQKWMPAISTGFIARTNVMNNACGVQLPGTNLCSALGHPELNHTTANADFYLVGSKLILQTAPMPILISGGVRGTNAQVLGMVGNASQWEARGFASAAIIFAGPGHSQVIFGSEISQEPRHPAYLDGKKNALYPSGGGPSYVLPSTLTYAVRVVPNPKHKFNVDFGYAQAAGDVGPSNTAGLPAHLNLECRHQIGIGVTYGF